MNHLKQLSLTLTFAGCLAAMPMAGQAHEHEDHADQHEHADHGSGMMHDDPSHQGMKDMFLEERMVDGYKVSFHVMPAQQGMEHGGSHNFMIKVEQGSKPLGDVKINSKVIFPDKKSATKGMMKMGDWYMAGYDLGQAGQHQLLILFKTADGKKHQTGVYYQP